MTDQRTDRRLPWQMFYWQDHFGDQAVQRLPPELERHWLRIVGLIHLEGDDGVLLIRLAFLGSHLGLEVTRAEEVLREIQDANVCGVRLEGANATITSRRMVRDAARRKDQRERKARHREAKRQGGRGTGKGEGSAGRNGDVPAGQHADVPKGRNAVVLLTQSPDTKDQKPEAICQRPEARGQSPKNSTTTALDHPKIPVVPVPARRSNPGAVDSVIDYYKSFFPRRRPGKQERSLIEARLREGYSPGDLCRAIDGNQRSEFHREKKFDSLELIVRDSKHVDQFITAMEVPAIPPLTARNRKTFEAAQSLMSAFSDKEQES